MSSFAPVLAGLVLALSACGDNPRGTPDPEPEPDAAVDPTAPDAAALDCNVQIHEIPQEPGKHYLPGVALVWSSNPPATGNHYEVWTHWNRNYETAIPRGYWVHNLEHGGVVLLHHCPDGCPDDVAALAAITAALPRDPKCGAKAHARTLITPDPELPDGVRFAASAWNWTYTATCVDPTSIRAFIDAHYNHGTEDLCGDGAYPPDSP